MPFPSKSNAVVKNKPKIVRKSKRMRSGISFPAESRRQRAEVVYIVSDRKMVH